MRNLKSKNMRKFLIAAMAVTMFPAASSNQAFAQNGDWDDLQSNVSSGGTVNLGADYVADKASGNTTINVPSQGVVINGSNGAGGKYMISGYKDNTTTGATAPQLINNTSTTGGLELNNVHLHQGGGNNGGAIGNTGVLEVNNSEFTDNTTVPPSGVGVNTGNGGAIYNDQGTVTVNNSTFTGNGVYKDTNGEIIYINDDGDPATPQDGGHPTVTINGGAIYNAAPSAAGDTTSTLNVQNNSKFESNYAANGGAIYNAGTADISNSSFVNNHAVVPSAGTTDGNHGRGGAVFNTGTDNSHNITIENSTFAGNTAEINSGALYNSNSTVGITGSTFDGNSAQAVDGTYGSGGALGNYRGGIINISEGTKFQNNYAGNGGAIYSSSLELSSSGDFYETSLSIDGSELNNNYSNNQGGAIWSYGKTTITGSTIHDNGINVDGSVKTSAGGAIYNSGRLTQSVTEKPNGTLQVENVKFENNFASDFGGAVANRGNGSVKDSNFINNGYSNNGGTDSITGSGGAISNRTPVGSGGNTFSVNNSYFKGNVANNGGAVHNESVITIQNSFFEENGKSTDGDVKSISGGALYNAANGTMNIIDSSFKGNVANSGGALYAASNSTTNISAVNNNVVFGEFDNENAATVDTVVLNSGAVANMNAAANRVIQFNSTVSGSAAGAKSEININPGDGNTGLVEFNATVSDADITLNRGTLRFGNDKNLGASNDLTLLGGTLNMLNGAVNPIGAGNININGNTNLVLDVDIANKTMDSILSDSTNVNYTSGNINISNMHSISDSSEKDVKILFTDVDSISGNGVVTNSINNGIINGPIHKYAVKQMYDDGVVSGDTPGEYFLFNQVGTSDNALIAPVAAQAGFLMMDNLYRQSFANMDMVMLMTREQREALKHRNQYASTDDVTAGLYQPTIIPEERDGFWVRPFANFENVPLSGGPRVSNVSYGALVGGDSDIIDIGHGWDATYSFFGAYHGSHQAYNGIGIWQNGGALGGVGTLYKGNFFTGLTANVSASGVSANSAYGNEDFPMLMTGAAWKTGYNFEFAGGKFILQPSYMMSYTFVNVFDYTDAAGLNISNDPLNVIELIPGVKLIMNTKTGWQPYLGVNMTWNLMNKTKFYANDVALDRLSVDPFVEYGVGVQKRVGDRLTGFGQAMVRNGGRNGIAFTMGWRWALGD